MKRPQKVSNVPKKEVFCKRPQKRRVVETPGILLTSERIYRFIAWISHNLRQPRSMTEICSMIRECAEKVSTTPCSTCFCKWSPERLRARLLPDHYLLRCRSSNNLDSGPGRGGSYLTLHTCPCSRTQGFLTNVWGTIPTEDVTVFL